MALGLNSNYQTYGCVKVQAIRTLVSRRPMLGVHFRASSPDAGSICRAERPSDISLTEE